jgi:hypothetical protein
MGDLIEFLKSSPIAASVSLATKVVVRRLCLAPGAVEEIVDNRSFAPEGGEVCELEVGGQCVARGKILRRKGKSYFKVIEINEGSER